MTVQSLVEHQLPMPILASSGSRHLRCRSPDHGRLVVAQLEEGRPQLCPVLLLQ
jgi:hypothetical protein